MSSSSESDVEDEARPTKWLGKLPQSPDERRRAPARTARRRSCHASRAGSARRAGSPRPQRTHRHDDATRLLDHPIHRGSKMIVLDPIGKNGGALVRILPSLAVW